MLAIDPSETKGMLCDVATILPASIHSLPPAKGAAPMLVLVGAEVVTARPLVFTGLSGVLRQKMLSLYIMN